MYNYRYLKTADKMYMYWTTQFDSTYSWPTQTLSYSAHSSNSAKLTHTSMTSSIYTRSWATSSTALVRSRTSLATWRRGSGGPSSGGSSAGGPQRPSHSSWRTMARTGRRARWGRPCICDRDGDGAQLWLGGESVIKLGLDFYDVNIVRFELNVLYSQWNRVSLFPFRELESTLMSL